MITTQSFVNVGCPEHEGIGRLFEAQNNVPGVVKYLEVLQAEEYVLFRLVHESEEQRYGYDSFRKIVEIRVEAQHIIDIEHVIDDQQRTVLTLPCIETGEEIGFVWNVSGQCLSIGTSIGPNRFIFIDLDPEQASSLSTHLYHLRNAHEEYIASLVDLTYTRDRWERIADALDNHHLATKIRHEFEGAWRDRPISISVRDWEAEEIEAAQHRLAMFRVDQWLEIVAALPEPTRSEIAAELGLINGTDAPYGTTPRSYMEIFVSLDQYDAVASAAYQCWLNAVPGSAFAD